MNQNNSLSLKFVQDNNQSEQYYRYELSSELEAKSYHDEIKQLSQDSTLEKIEIKLGQGLYELKRESEQKEYENSILKRINLIIGVLIQLDILKNIKIFEFLNSNSSFQIIDSIIPIISEIPSMKVLVLINPSISIQSIQLLQNYLSRSGCIVSSLTLEIQSVIIKNYDPKEGIIYKENHSISKLFIKSLLNHKNDNMKIFNIISSFKNLTDVVLDLDQISNASKIYEVFSELTKISDKLTHLKLIAQNYIMEEGSFKMLEKLTNLKLLQISGQFTLNKIDLDLSRLKNLTHLKLNVTNSLQYLIEIQEIENLTELHIITNNLIKNNNKQSNKKNNSLSNNEINLSSLKNFKNIKHIIIEFYEFQKGCENQIIDNLNIISTICHQLNSLSLNFSNNLYFKKTVMSSSFIQKLGDFFSKCHFISTISINNLSCLMDDVCRYDLAYSLLKTQSNNDYSLSLYQGLSVNGMNLLSALTPFISKTNKTINIPNQHRQQIYLLAIVSQLKQYENYTLKINLSDYDIINRFDCKKSKQNEIFRDFKKYSILYSGNHTFNNKETFQQISAIDKFVNKNNIISLNIKNKSVTLYTILSVIKKYPKLQCLSFLPDFESKFYDVDIPQFLKQCRKIQLKIRIKHLGTFNILKFFELKGFNIKINVHPHNLKKINKQELFNQILLADNSILIYRIYSNKNLRESDDYYNQDPTQDDVLINEHCKMVNQQILILIPYYRLISQEQIIHPCQLYIDLLLN